MPLSSLSIALFVVGALLFSFSCMYSTFLVCRYATTAKIAGSKPRTPVAVVIFDSLSNVEENDSNDNDETPIREGVVTGIPAYGSWVEGAFFANTQTRGGD